MDNKKVDEIQKQENPNRERSTIVRKKSNTKAKFIAFLIFLVAVLAAAFYIKYKYIDNTADGFPKLEMLEQDFSPDGNSILRLYGQTGSETDKVRSRFEIEQNGETYTIWYKEGTNPLSIKYDWSDDSQTITINGEILDKNTKLTKE